MLERDYIMRIIAEFVRALARITERKEAHEYDQALEEINGAIEAASGMSTSQLVSLPVAGILGLCRGEGGVEIDHAAALARLLKEQGEVLQRSGMGTPKPYFIKAFCLYDELAGMARPHEFDEHQETLDWLVARLD